MKIAYDAEVDILRITLSDQIVDESDEDKPCIIIDYDAQGNIVSLEILDASKRGLNPHGVEYALTGLKGA
jgi:uncharacterized protein YuzE